MKAFILEKYGPPETLRMAEVEKPAPAADEVLVKVLAVSVNPADWRSMLAKPSFLAPLWGCCGQNIESSAATLPGEWRRLAAASPSSSPATRVYANLLDHGSGGFAEYVSVPRRDGLAFDDSEPESTTLSRDAEVGEVDVDPPIVGQPGRTGCGAPPHTRRFVEM
jgi:NADPH:quinone reductase-like Zn-dependent oxidoreductase